MWDRKKKINCLSKYFSSLSHIPICFWANNKIVQTKKHFEKETMNRKLTEFDCVNFPNRLQLQTKMKKNIMWKKWKLKRKITKTWFNLSSLFFLWVCNSISSNTSSALSSWSYKFLYHFEMFNEEISQFLNSMSSFSVIVVVWRCRLLNNTSRKCVCINLLQLDYCRK